MSRVGRGPFFVCAGCSVSGRSDTDGGFMSLISSCSRHISERVFRVNAYPVPI
ncbi:hypothetical protein B005_3877 [Nocardiopsis alba ATCC BAA-2165]|uniref:Uncharacterized protein n=1 Tax=Nocardiopsis alba (strain ATCC BAA-2165 / BE74) TaxID=1205910 RepID=J7L7Y7_NOCAA|nr:hypothetical protein B005_3877 [Nocardiopsis alba ATCC BAA-2165]